MQEFKKPSNWMREKPYYPDEDEILKLAFANNYAEKKSGQPKLLQYLQQELLLEVFR